MYGILMTESGFALSNLLESGTSILTWFITSMGSILNFFTTNTALLVWFLVSLAGAAFVFFRKLF